MIKERRVINISKDNYDVIKNFCDKHALKMSDWIVLKIMEIIKNFEDGKKKSSN